MTKICYKQTCIYYLGQDMVFVSLILAMIVSLILGLPLNITPTYILTASLAGPALVSIGLPVLSAAVCTAHQMLEKLGLATISPNAGALL